MLKKRNMGILVYALSAFSVLFGNAPQAAFEEEIRDYSNDDPITRYEQLQKKALCPHDRVVDYIVVGNGTAGAVVARSLSDNHKNSVLCLEIGRNRTTDPAVTSPNPFDPLYFNDLTIDARYAVTYPVALSYGTFSIYSEGRMWGGSSAHNYVQAVRGTPSIYDSWASFSGNSIWLYNNLLPTMKAIETYTPNGTPINTNQRGTNGPLFITQTPPVTSDPLAIGLSLGTTTPFVNDYNNIAEGPLGISANQEFVTPGPNSQRSFSQTAYLQVGEIIDADGNGLHGRRLKVESAAFTNRVLFKGNKAIGVEYIKNFGTVHEKIVKVYARRKVILSAGSVNTPAILQRSGVGDPNLLNSLGIEVVVNSPHVGKNLINQYGATGTLVGVNASNSVGFINGAPFFPNDGVRRLQIIPIFFGPGVAGILGFNLHPASRGSIEIADSNPLINPNVDLNMYSDAAGYDASVIIAFYKLLQSISANIPGSAVVYPTPADYLSDASLLLAAQNAAHFTISYHMMGTTRMASSIADGVVDGRLHVFGTRHLMIADAGVASAIEDGNTAFSVFVIGNVAAQILASE